VRLHVDLSVDDVRIEAIGSKARVDLGCSHWINPPAERILTRVVLGLVLAVGYNSSQIDAPNAASIAFWR
jgi:hypothetical protein